MTLESKKEASFRACEALHRMGLGAKGGALDYGEGDFCRKLN
jgi:hypothetical protein